MDRESAQMSETKRRAEELDQQQRETSMAARQGAPEYWKQFIDEVKALTAGLEERFTKSPDEKIVGWAAVEEPNANFPDYRCTVKVDRHSTEFENDSCQLDFYYQTGATQIKRSARGQQDVFIDLHAGSQGMVAELNGYLMTAKQFAVSIVQEMYERVRFPV
jgi:hypothetical protein